MFTPRRIFPLVFAVAFLAFQGTASAAQFINPAPIKVNQFGPASPSPSTVEVKGQEGPIKELKVALLNVDHTAPGQLDVLLVAPNGQTSVVMSDTCEFQGVTDRIWSFSSKPAPGTPLMGSNCSAINYRATDLDNGDPDRWPGAPEGPYSADLSKFENMDPNGVWSLYVVDDQAGFEGNIKTGWALTIDTGDTKIKIPSSGTSGPADPYPATQTVSGQTGVVADLNVGITGIYHQRPDDLDALLVGPQGQRVMLASDACGETFPTRAAWLFDDGDALGGNPLPDNGGCQALGSFKPTDHEPGESLSAPAPPAPYGNTMAEFAGTNPNGDWKLYVEDDTPGKIGWVANDGKPFELRMTTRQPAAVRFADPGATVPEGLTGAVRITRSANGPLGAGSVRVTSTAGTATAGRDFTPVSTTVQFAREETEKTVPVAALTDAANEPAETLSLAITNATGDAAAGTPSRFAVTITEGGPRPRTGDQSGEDRTAPAIGRVRLTPARFAVLRGKARRARRGTKIRYSLSEPARVTMRVQRRRGRRWVRATTLRQAGRAGINRKSFSGRVRRRALRPGTYRVVLTAVDAAGNAAKAKPRRFRIVRP